MDGFVILDKPAGLTSHDCCEKVKKILNARKTGHAGTLDIGVTGVLVIAMDESVKLLRLFSGLPKEYIGEAILHTDVSLEKLNDAVNNKFLGKIKQTPPKRSRVKRQEREREIFEFKILEKEGRRFSYKVSCQAGTYIRKLIDDLGLELGIKANMTKLRRTKHSCFDEKESVSFEKLTKEKVIDSIDAIKRIGVKIIKVNDNQEDELRKGKSLGISVKEENLIVAANKNRIVALVQKKNNLIKPERVLN
jgi:H/ACA ribonucleoprotein complex subunit 4